MVPRPVYQIDPVPPEYADWNRDRRMAWLDSQGLPSDPAVNLGDCYRRGAQLTHFFSSVFKLFKRISQSDAPRANPTVGRLLKYFIAILNDGPARLSNKIHADCEKLLANGSFVDDARPILPLRVPQMPTFNDSEDLGKALLFTSCFWGMFIDTTRELIVKWPWMSGVQPGLNCSYRQILVSTIHAGQALWNEMQKVHFREGPSGECDEILHLLVSNAYTDGLSRRVTPKIVEKEADPIMNDEFQELTALRELQPAWPRVLFTVKCAK